MVAAAGVTVDQEKKSGVAMNRSHPTTVNTESFTGNVEPLLCEIRHALRRLAEGQAGTAIDLCSLPLAPREVEILEAELGQGEIQAELNALGLTTIRETSIAGVWLVTHHNEAQEVVSKFIEVTRCPELLQTQQRDLETGLDRLDQRLNDKPGGRSGANSIDDRH